MTSTPPPDRSLVELFTDGACSGNPGPGGWAYLLRHPASGTERSGSGGERKTTNNRMELTAAIEGLRGMKRGSVVHLYSDSQYVLKGLNEWMPQWKRNDWRRGKKREPVMNVDLWQALDEEASRHEVHFHWVKGHNNHPENELCDAMAVAAMEAYR